MKIQTVTKLACDFCEKSEDDVAKLFAGPRHVCICNECAGLCGEILAKEKQEAIGSSEVVKLVRDWVNRAEYARRLGMLPPSSDLLIKGLTSLAEV